MGSSDLQLRTHVDWFCHMDLGEPYNFLNQHPLPVPAAPQQPQLSTTWEDKDSCACWLPQMFPQQCYAAGSPGSSNMQKDAGVLCTTARNATCSGLARTGLLFLPAEDCEKREMFFFCFFFFKSNCMLIADYNCLCAL